MRPGPVRLVGRCLGDAALVHLQSGDGSPEEWGHLADCAACGGRYGALVADLALIRRALDGPPPPRSVTQPALSGARRWLPSVAAVALVLAAVGGVWLRYPGTPADGVAADSVVASVLHGVSAGLFSTLDPARTVLAADDGLLGGETGCEWPAALTGECEPGHGTDVAELVSLEE